MELNLPEHLESQQDNFPFPGPFCLSSVERDWCRFQPDRNAAVVFIKRRHLEENLKTIAHEIGMDEAEQKKFLDWWCCPNLDEIRAEGDPYFNLRYRAENWMEKRKQRPEDQKPKSRLEKYVKSAQEFMNNAKSKTIPTSPAGTQGFGYADIPDEQ